MEKRVENRLVVYVLWLYYSGTVGLIRKYGDNKDRKTASSEICYNGKGTWLHTIGNDHNTELFLYWTIHRETLVYKNGPLVIRY